MRMVCKEYGIDCLFQEHYATELLIDSSDIFLRFMTKIWKQYHGEEEFLIISEFDKEIRFDKVVEIISDPFQLDVNNRKILTKIYQSIVRESQESNQEQILQLQSLMEKYVIESCDNSDFILTYTPNLDLTDLLKMYNVQIDTTDMDVASRLLSYIKMSHRVLGTTLFVLVNIKSYFVQGIWEQLIHTLCYENINVLLIERNDMGVLGQEKRIIIDKDACIICD